jgi:23S rRNA pseudouridine2604 synthase
LQGYDIKTNYRKANIVSKQAQKAKADKPLSASTEGIDREQVKLETTIKKKKKGGSGLRVGKSRVVEKKTQPPKQNSPIRKGRKV